MPTNTILNGQATRFIQGLSFLVKQQFSPWSVLTHAWDENGGFAHIIGQNNFWGIKSSSTWKGLTVSVPTHEYINGVYTAVTADFRDWATLQDAMEWYSSLIQRIYPDAWTNRKDPLLFFEGLMHGIVLDGHPAQYCTNPNYVSDLTKLYSKLSANTEIGDCIQQYAFK